MTTIEWTDETWNPAVGCSRVSAGCENCYAETFVHRGLTEAHRGLTVLGKHGPRWNGTVRFLPDRLETPLRWKKPRRVFVNSLSDLFHEALTNEEIAAVFGVMAACPQHTFQVLTKRARRMREWFAWIAGDGRLDPPPTFVAETCAENLCVEIDRLEPPWPLANVHLGVSVENQATADERIPALLATPAAVRFVSYEPALSGVSFRCIGYGPSNRGFVDALTGETECAEVRGRPHAAAPLPRLDWIIVGGESGPGARPFDLAWARSVIAQCRAAGVPVFVKQLGANPMEVTAAGTAWDPCLIDRKGGDMREWPESLRVRMFPGDTWAERTHG